MSTRLELFHAKELSSLYIYIFGVAVSDKKCHTVIWFQVF